MDPNSISRRRSLFAAALLAAALARPAFAARPPKQWDGLERVKSKRVQYLYLRPGVSFAGYQRVKLDPCAVSFDKNWDPARDTRNALRRPTKADMEAIRTDLATEFGRVFAQELARGGYTLTDESADDVLRVVPSITDLYLAAPGEIIAGRGQGLVAETGNMTLVAELRDAVSGQLLARVIDKQDVAAAGGFEVGPGAPKTATSGQVIARWAGILRQGLDEAKSRATPK